MGELMAELDHACDLVHAQEEQHNQEIVNSFMGPIDSIANGSTEDIAPNRPQSVSVGSGLKLSLATTASPLFL